MPVGSPRLDVKMLDTLRDNHSELLATLFAVMVVATAWLEAFLPRRPVDVPRSRRWISNLSIGALNTAIFTFAVPVGAFTAAIIAEEHVWGALRLVPVPVWLPILLGVLAIDVVGYLSHRVLHVMPAMWQLHQVHHSDIDIDFTTTVRHHPLETLLGGGVIFAAIIALGVPVESVVLHQIAATVLDFANHSNVRIPQRLDGWIRWIFVTPDMHVVHHSAMKRETNSNYGAMLSLWDRLFGTYVAAPAQGLTGMTIGLEYRREASDQRLDHILLSPFAKPPLARLVRTPAVAGTPD
jgi:sterol desaturase/sphingolipid hydroxylase (fatty acid hydroxylase superfamily)